ncbi:hypothetical protein [Fulvivirga sedimenti]|uniref:DUF3899 domain-containing protein n=1 Tax=Fulvivirga sedimenti TaxID=2879465 RepID=A0A9X1HPI2_9BACT|nr:hypothetical protein [Fulvivirga sedimenti]MCA6074397.1 hypothetical protein [Fulvivirga sedimenti]
MNAAIIFGGVALFFLWYNLFVSIRIVDYLRKNEQNATLFNSGFFVKGKIFKYLPIYKEVSFNKEGKVGNLYQQFIISFLGIMLFLLLGIISVIL